MSEKEFVKNAVGRIVIEAPDKNSPGFLKRLRRGLKLQNMVENMQENADPEAAEVLVAFILDFVVVPEDRAEAEELVWEMSQQDFETALAVINGTNETEEDEAETENL